MIYFYPLSCANKQFSKKKGNYTKHIINKKITGMILKHKKIVCVCVYANSSECNYTCMYIKKKKLAVFNNI